MTAPKDDLLREHSEELSIDAAREHLRRLHKAKNLPYRELFLSREHGDLRYLLVEENDLRGTISITDLATKQIQILINEPNCTNDR